MANTQMQPKTFRMSFDGFRLLNLSFSINKGFNQKKGMRINPEIALAHHYEPKEKTVKVRIKVSLAEENIPFFFEVESEGKFVFKETPDNITIKNVSIVNGPAIMFPYVRETIADLTRRAGFPPLHLPPVNFVELAKHSKTK